jgi:3-dehydrosphinganine reductase
MCVVVTGGGSGIGLATARQYASRGADVAIVGRTRERLVSAVEDLRNTGVMSGQRFAARVADLSTFEAAKEALDLLAADGFSPDILVNSAGVIMPGEFANMPLADFESNLDNGYWSVVYPCRAAIPRMAEKGRGHIVNVSSVAGYMGIYGYTGYSSAKYAVMGFSEALRFELKSAGIKVHVVCPPDTDTPALAKEREMRPAITDALAGSIKPISADRVAKAITSGVDKGKYFIIPDATSALYFRLKGLLPELFFGIVDGDVAKARKG